MTRLRITINRNVAGRWYWVLIGGNGETLAHSQSYSTKWSAMRTAKKLSHILNAPIVVGEIER